MTPGVTTIVIPTYQGESFVVEALESACAQTAPVDVVLVDDGSTDDTPRELMEARRRGCNFRYVRIEHGGPAAARNRGIEEARGEFLMFLDVDDLIDPRKVEKQLFAMQASRLGAGWAFCDVVILEPGRPATTASKRYGYDERRLRGWLAEDLGRANYIPNMAPLIRAALLENGGPRFTRTPQPNEDWPFLVDVARLAPAEYVPEALATYRKRANSWSRPGGTTVTLPLRLNLGCGMPGSAAWRPIAGFANLDKSLGWRFEDGLGQYGDGSVAGITISHALMYVAAGDWPRVFREFARVLRPGGVVRITEDDTSNPASRTFGGWRGRFPPVMLTEPSLVKFALLEAGLEPHDVAPDASHYVDGSLLQQHYGDRPHVFFVEGVKP